MESSKGNSDSSEEQPENDDIKVSFIILSKHLKFDCRVLLKHFKLLFKNVFEDFFLSYIVI